MIKGSYQKAGRAGFIKVALRYIEDPNRSLISRLFLAVSPLLFLYIISPLDLVPEAILGPLGLADDGAILVAFILIYRLAHSFYKDKKYSNKNTSVQQNEN